MGTPTTSGSRAFDATSDRDRARRPGPALCPQASRPRSDPGSLLAHVVGGYDEYHVPPALKPFAHALWVHRALAGATPSTHRVVPEPDVSVALATYERADGRTETGGLYLVGPVRTARFYAPEAGARMVAVRLKPEWCRPLLGVHPSDHLDAVDDLSELRPDLAHPILEELLGSVREADVFRCLSRAVMSWARAARVTPDTAAAHQALELLRAAGHGTRIRSAWEPLESSSRQLRRVVRSATGSSAKRLLREKRLAAALYQADREAEPSWSRIAVVCGYYDQSHLIRDCTELAGAPPVTLHRERRRQPRSR